MSDFSIEVLEGIRDGVISGDNFDINCEHRGKFICFYDIESAYQVHSAYYCYDCKFVIEVHSFGCSVTGMPSSLGDCDCETLKTFMRYGFPRDDIEEYMGKDHADRVFAELEYILRDEYGLEWESAREFVRNQDFSKPFTLNPNTHDVVYLAASMYGNWDTFSKIRDIVDGK